VLKRREAIKAFPEFEATQAQAIETRNHTLAHLDTYLQEFETNVKRTGGVVHWASSTDEANKIVARICKEAKARRITADAEAYATEVVARAIKENGIEAAQYQVALKQVEALTAVGAGEGRQTIILPAAALDAFGQAFDMLKGRA